MCTIYRRRRPAPQRRRGRADGTLCPPVAAGLGYTSSVPRTSSSSRLQPPWRPVPPRCARPAPQRAPPDRTRSGSTARQRPPAPHEGRHGAYKGASARTAVRRHYRLHAVERLHRTRYCHRRLSQAEYVSLLESDERHIVKELRAAGVTAQPVRSWGGAAHHRGRASRRAVTWARNPAGAWDPR